MAISAVSAGQTSTGQVSSSNQSQIKALEKQKQQIQKEINDINQDKETTAEDKQKQIQVLQKQLQTIETQIQQLEQQSTAAAGSQPGNTSAAAVQQSTGSKQQLLRQTVDIEA
ncbi:FlxA-like protein [Anaerospora hongkongensis]|uniref:FlxA-like protein n=1 Tax=Anaerospora hongkongensis TaxID=244830 RepID=A0A4R1PZW1_9FIRM|nr:FlxA-like family protein [Anaerospora hongkongensis]TCL36452.1 FlxA-like protein [Anaerospora hongkongensis]